MDFENMNIWCWLIPLLCTLIGVLFGYLIGKGGSTSIDNSSELKILNDKNAKLQADLDACNSKLSTKADAPSVSSEPTASSSFAAAATDSAIPFNAAAAQSAMGKTIKQDDLKVVEGIGPKISGMFIDAGITTWKALSETSVARCQEILNGGGERYKVHDPASWPMQAKMCYEGKWAELSKWQDEHDHGKL